jgi:hypothetical protein
MFHLLQGNSGTSDRRGGASENLDRILPSKRLAFTPDAPQIVQRRCRLVKQFQLSRISQKAHPAPLLAYD